jgi:hypothetical protein
VYPAHPTQVKPPPGAPPATFEESTADLAGVPDGLCAATRWLLWRYEWRPAEGKWTKVPISSETGHPADGTPPDTGLTLHYLCRTFALRGPDSLVCATLFDRPYRRLVDDLPIRYVGFTVPDEFFAGYGFDVDEHWRNLPDLHLVREV